VTSSRSSNTSRAFWELRAEQIMDRVFTPAMAAVVLPEVLIVDMSLLRVIYKQYMSLPNLQGYLY